MDCIEVNGIRLFSYHGCLDEEALIGSDYEVNLKVWADLNKAAETDHLKDTVDYVTLNRIVEEEMAIRSKLLETVALRIIQKIFEELIPVLETEVAVTKLFPPINGDVQRVTVQMHRKR